MSRGVWAVAGMLFLAPAAMTAEREVIDVHSARARGADTFEATWEQYRKAESGGDHDRASQLIEALNQQRIERNVSSLEVVALALVWNGVERLHSGATDLAEESFRNAIRLDPHLPDAYLGLASAKLRRGPLMFASAARDLLAGVTARWSTTRGQMLLWNLLVPAAFIALLAATFIFATAMVLRYGVLLRHDIEEALDADRAGIAVGLYLILLLLPLLAFQGWAWVPFWWLALLLLFARPTEQAVTLLLVALFIVLGPIADWTQLHLKTARNPLFRATIMTVEGGPDVRAIAEIEKARAALPDDRDLTYLLAAQYKRAGRYDDAAQLYRGILAADPKDTLALNNLANIEFADAEFQAAIARYKSAIEAATLPRERATLFYNLSLAHLQRFQYQDAQKARSQADRIARDLTAEYESTWSQKREGSSVAAVADLGLSAAQVDAKFLGAVDGVAKQNVYQAATAGPTLLDMWPGLMNRFTGLLGLIAVVHFVQTKLRGKKAFTMRCLKCGVPFCRKCHLGASIGGLCTQCHHLFIVRDGVSGPARNQKLLEVQKEDERRDRVFKMLSLISPGAGHIYGRKTLLGLLLVTAWYFVIALTLLSYRLFPITEAPARLAGPWGLILAVLLLITVYVVANRGRLDSEAVIPVWRGGVRRPRSA